MNEVKEKILIVVDMQKDFVDGTLGTPEAQAIVPNIVKKIEEYKAMDNDEHTTIIFTLDTHFGDYFDTLEGRKLPVLHCVRGTAGWELAKEIDALVDKYNDITIEKPTFGSIDLVNSLIDDFTDKDIYSEDIEIELCGLCTDICVVSNALLLRATFPNVKITVDASCCAGVTPEKHKCALETMKSCQIDVINE